jgi:predicted Holliday junction resolvase-like endonuclease
MSENIVKFFGLQRRIFGICPECNKFFRLSDCRIFFKKKPVLDWMDLLDTESQKLYSREQRLKDKKKEIQIKASAEGRHLAQLQANRIDKIFAPRKLNPDDAKVILNPIDYVVFNGMNTEDTIKNIVMLDRQTKRQAHLKVQKSIEKAIHKDNYEWQTIRIKEDGSIKIE